MTNTEKKYFYGNEVSSYGVEHGKVDYRCFSKAFDCVLNNDLMSTLESNGYYFELVSGFIDNSEEIEETTSDIEELEELEESGEITDDQSAELDNLRDYLEHLEEEDGQIPCADIFQYYIVPSTEWVLDLLKENNEIVFYNEELDLTIWGVTHWGTSWDYVLTNIDC